jgi:dTDP-4-dehydrorhamnose 3,5-epimerase
MYFLGEKNMEVYNTTLEGVLHVKARCFQDERGALMPLALPSELARHFSTGSFTLVSQNNAGVLRGMHFQEEPYAQAKIALVLTGNIRDIVAHTTDPSRHEVFELSGGEGLFIPKGYAHGFYAPVPSTLLYFISDPFHLPASKGFKWDDPALNLPWGTITPLLSEKDRTLPLFHEMNKQ